MSMAGPNGTDPETTDAPDDGMASGSDAGEPGSHLGPGDLDPDEERLLAALERDAQGLHEPSVEESPVHGTRPRLRRAARSEACRSRRAPPSARSRPVTASIRASR